MNAYEIVQKIKKGNKKSTLVETANGSLVGAGIGLSAGAIIGWIRKGNIWVYALTGMVVGSVISSIFIIKK